MLGSYVVEERLVVAVEVVAMVLAVRQLVGLTLPNTMAVKLVSVPAMSVREVAAPSAFMELGYMRGTLRFVQRPFTTEGLLLRTVDR
jgi:hypothetical protein